MGGLFASLTGEDVDRAGSSGRRAAEIPPELRQFMEQLSNLTRFRVGEGGGVTPFVESPAVPNLSMTPLEQELTGFGTNLMRSVGTKPIEEAFGSARSLTGQSRNFDDITRDVSGTLSPAIQNILERERRGSRQIGEELTSQGAYMGSPLLENQRMLQEQSNRDISEVVGSAVMKERELRGGEAVAGGEQMLRTGAATPLLADRYASLPRDIQTQQYGLESAGAADRSQMIQQVLDLVLGGAGVGTSQYGIRSNAVLGGEQLFQNARQQQLDTEQQMVQMIMMAAGACWVAGAIYGIGTPNFWKAREWIFKRWQGPVASAVRWLYLRIGRQLAPHVAAKPWLKAALKPFFDWSVGRCEAARAAEGR